MWKASMILSVLTTLIVTSLTKADYYKYNQRQYRQSITRFKCTEEGYHADPQDCRIYYRCVDWGNGSPLTTFKFECGVGTVFSKNKGDICTHPGDSGRPECAGSENELDSNLQENSPEYPSPIWTTTVKTTRPQQITTQSPVTTRQPTITIQTPTTTRKPETAQSSLTSRPTTDQPENNCKDKLQCTQEEFLADTCDCRRFYRCVDGGNGKFIKYDFTCGSGTVWDPEIQGCNHAWVVTRKNCRQSLENENNGNKDGQWHEDTGDNNGQWNNNIGSVDQSGSPGQAGDSNNQPGQPGQASPDHSGSITDSPGYPGISGPPGGPSYPGSPGYPGIPDTPGSPGYPDSPGYPETPGSSGTPGSSETSEGPSNPDLSETPSPSGSSSTPDLSGIPAPGTQGSPGTSCSPGTSDNLGSPSSPNQPLAGNCTQEGFFPHPNDCRKFYRCVNNGMSFTKYEFQCGAETVWDSSVESCNHIYAVPHCTQTGDMVTNEPDTSLNEVDSADRPDDTSKLPPVQSPESSLTPPISSEPEISSSTQQIEGTTSKPANTEPSQTTSSSYLPPVSSTSTESVSYLPPVTTQVTTSTSHLPSSSSATTDATSGSRPESVSYLPPDTSSTSVDTGSSASSPQTGKYECTEEGFFSNPNDCKKFYRCIQGQSGYQKYDFDCGPGTAWDQSVQTCNYIEQVASCSKENKEIDQGPTSSTSNPASDSPATSSSTTTASSQITTTTLSSVSSPTTVVSTPETSTELSPPEGDKTEVSSTTIASVDEKPASGKPEEIQTSESSSTESSSESSSETSSSESSEESSSSTESHAPDCTNQKQNNTIVCNNAGFYPHPARCDKFYRCVDNGNGFNVYHFDCPPGTIFDPSISVCNHPESVYPARDCATGGTTSSNANVEPTTESETSEEPAATTTAQSTAEQTEESTITSDTTTLSAETTTLEESTGTSEVESTTAETSESTESATESTESATEAPAASTESIESTTESQESAETTESQEQTTTESQEQSTTESSSMEEGQEQSTTESEQEQLTTESEEQSTTESEEQSTTESSEQTTAEPPAGAVPCTIGNLTEEQITLVCPTGFRKHPKYCNLFYQCTTEGMEIKILVLGCPEDTIFDEKKIQCLPEDKSSEPCTGSKASVRLYRRVENDDLSPVKVSSNQLCPEEGHFPYRQGCSNNFYKCKRDSRNDLQGYFYKCPESFVYWSVSRRCERVTHLPMCSHLAYRNKTDWNDRWQIPTERFNLSAS